MDKFIIDAQPSDISSAFVIGSVLSYFPKKLCVAIALETDALRLALGVSVQQAGVAAREQLLMPAPPQEDEEYKNNIHTYVCFST